MRKYIIILSIIVLAIIFSIIILCAVMVNLNPSTSNLLVHGGIGSS